jgi:hypothetical protein
MRVAVEAEACIDGGLRDGNQKSYASLEVIVVRSLGEENGLAPWSTCSTLDCQRFMPIRNTGKHSRTRTTIQKSASTRTP